MSDNDNYVTKQTLLISVAVALVVGFLSGVVYSVYNAPSSNQAAHAPPNEKQAAITSLELETRKNPDNGVAWFQLGHAYFDSNQFAKAIKVYNKGLEILPENTNGLTDLGVMYRRNGQPDKAIATFDKALRIDPQHEQAMFNKGVVLLNDLKDRKGALNVWRQLVAINKFAAASSGTLVAEIIDQVAAQPVPGASGEKN